MSNLTPELLFNLIRTPIGSFVSDFGRYFGVVNNNIIFTYRYTPFYINDINNLPNIVEKLPIEFGIPFSSELEIIKPYINSSNSILELLHLDMNITNSSNKTFYLIPVARHSCRI